MDYPDDQEELSKAENIVYSRVLDIVDYRDDQEKVSKEPDFLALRVPVLIVIASSVSQEPDARKEELSDGKLIWKNITEKSNSEANLQYSPEEDALVRSIQLISISNLISNQFQIKFLLPNF